MTPGKAPLSQPGEGTDSARSAIHLRKRAGVSGGAAQHPLTEQETR